MSDINERLLNELVSAVKEIVRKEQSDRLRDIYLIGDIEKDTARAVIERLRELANDSVKPITLYMNSAGGNVDKSLYSGEMSGWRRFSIGIPGSN